MSRFGLALISCSALLVGCSRPPEAAPLRTAAGPPQPSEIVFQAVDAGTGAALADDDLTVRYLVRAPITLDTSALEQVPAAQPYHIRHDVAEDSLVVEVRLEAPSYHRLDTVLAVPRGDQTGPLTLRMARRLERAASTGEETPPAAGETTPAASKPAAPPAKPVETSPRPKTPTPTPAPPPEHLSAMEEGDRAFQARNWRAAIEAYGRMPVPSDPSSAEGRVYEAALVRQGIANINLGAYGGAIETLRKAVAMGLPDARAHLRLAQAQCAVGRVDEGRRTLEGIRSMGSRLTDQEKPVVRALAEYQTAVCSQSEIDKAPTTIGRVRAGSKAVREFQAFFQTAASISPAPPELAVAVADARRRVEAIRQRMRGGDGDA